MPQGPAILRSAVAIANSVTRSLNFQAVVLYERDLGEDSEGTRVFAVPPVPLHAIVDFQGVTVRTRDGVLTVSRATIDLLDIKEIIAATDGEGIGNNDRFTLPDGDTGPILDISGFVDAGTTHPIATTVKIG